MLNTASYAKWSVTLEQVGLQLKPTQCPTHLTGVIVLRVEQVAELGQELWPHLQLPLGSNGCYKNPCQQKLAKKCGSTAHKYFFVLIMNPTITIPE